MSLNNKFFFSILSISGILFLFYVCIYLDNNENHITKRNLIKNKKILIKNSEIFFENDQNSIVYINALPKKIEPNSEWTLSWSTNPIHLADNTWIR